MTNEDKEAIMRALYALLVGVEGGELRISAERALVKRLSLLTPDFIAPLEEDSDED